MVLEVLSKLEKKIQKSVDIVVLLKLETEELKKKNINLKKEIQDLYLLKEAIENKYNKLKDKQEEWKNRLKNLLNKVNNYN